MTTSGPRVLLSMALSLPLLASFGCARDASTRHASSEGPEPLVEAVVYTTLRPQNLDLYLFEGPDQEARRIRDHPAVDYNATFSPDGRWLVFTSERSGNPELWAMEVGAGGEPFPLTRNEALDDAADFSPDGRSLAFVSTRDGDADIFTMPFDPDDPTAEERASNLTRRPGGDFHPAFSPDGRRIAYSRQDNLWSDLSSENPVFDSNGADLYVMNADGSDPRELVGQVPGPEVEPGVAYGEYFAPDFDPGSGRMVTHGPGSTEGWAGTLRDGILFAPPGGRSRAQLPDRELAVWGVRGYFPALTPGGEIVSTVLDQPRPAMPLSRTSIDGSSRTEIFSPDGFAWGPAIARDAGVIVVAVGPPFAPGSAEVDIWKLSLDGSDPTNLTASVSANDALPHVSADGSRIVFRTGGDGGVGTVLSMDGDGGGRSRLTDDDAAETMPALSPDGEWVVFPTDRAGGRKLWMQRVDGSEGRFLEPERLDIPDTSMHPRFSPDGAWVVFTSDRGGYNDEWPLTPFPQPYGDLWAVSVEDGSTVRLTHNKWEDGPSDWGPLRLPGSDPGGA